MIPEAVFLPAPYRQMANANKHIILGREVLRDWVTNLIYPKKQDPGRFADTFCWLTTFCLSVIGLFFIEGHC